MKTRNLLLGGLAAIAVICLIGAGTISYTVVFDNIQVRTNATINALTVTNGAAFNAGLSAGGSGTSVFTNGAALLNVTASRAVVTDSAQNLTNSATTATEIGYVSGVTSAIQTQLGARVLKAGDTMTGNLHTTMSAMPTTYADLDGLNVQTNVMSGNLTLAHATNGASGTFKSVVLWFVNDMGAASRTVTIPVISSGANGWRTNVFSSVSAVMNVTNSMFLYLKATGPTDSLALQTNVWVSAEWY